jgi:hypothetical protein
VQCGDVIKIRTSGEPRLGLVKAPFGTIRVFDPVSRQWTPIPEGIVYLPGIEDQKLHPHAVLDESPSCDICGSTMWYWTGDMPLFPEAILCSTCHPPNISTDEKREAIAEACAVVEYKMPELVVQIRDNPDWFMSLPWPDLQQRLFGCWVSAVSEIR